MSKADRIIEAIERGDLEAVKREAAAVNERGECDVTPLHAAAREGRSEIAAWLVAQGADLTAVDSEHGATPLGWAAYYGRADVVETLLAAGADAGHVNAYGETPLQVARDGEQGKWARYASAGPDDYRAVIAVLQRRGAG